MALAEAPPRKTISSRRDTLLVYVVLMLFAVPVWWRTTEVSSLLTTYWSEST